MLDKTTARQFIAPRRRQYKIRNPNIEIRNKSKDVKPNYEIRNDLVWNFVLFDHLDLFRISDFELRICNFAMLGVLCAFARVAVFPIPFSSYQNFKYVWLGFAPVSC
jgi:hypothetical protein